MGSHDYEKILSDINTVRFELHDLEAKIDDLEKDIRSEFTHNLEKVEWQHQNYDRRISLTEKVLFGAVGITLVTVLGALLSKIIV